MLPESPTKVNQKITLVSTEKQIKNMAKFHRENKFIIFNDTVEVKHLKKALEARKGKSFVTFRIKIQKPKLAMSIKPPAKKEIKIDSYLKCNSLDNPNS